MKLVKELEQVLADTYALYLKTQNYHWNIEGKRFRELHAYFEDQYDEPYDRFEYEEIKEEYSYTINNESLKVSLTADNEIIINDGEESVKINNSEFDFLFNTLSKLLNM